MLRRRGSAGSSEDWDMAELHLPPTWRRTPLDSATRATITYGIVQAGPHVPGGIPYIRTGDMSADQLTVDGLLRTSKRIAARYLRSQVDEGDIVCAIRATVGKVLPVPRELDGANLTQGTARIAADPSAATAGYLLWALRSTGVQQQFDRSIKGTTFKEITLGKLREVYVDLPPLPEQRQIAEVLDTVDEAIRKTEQIIAKLKQVKQGLLHDLLTRGIDDNGELRDPDRHPEQFKDSALGRIPKAWDVVELGVVVPKAVYGISESLDAGPGIPVLRMMNFKDGEADVTDLKFSRSKTARELLLRNGDVLFNRTNSIDHVGRTGIWRWQIAEASFASYLVRLEPDDHRLRAEFLNRWLNWDLTQLRIRRVATPGVHQVNINPTNLRKTTIALPTSLEEQDAAVTALAELDTRLRCEIAESAKMRLLKQGLMEDLLTGRVRVTKLLEDAAQ